MNIAYNKEHVGDVLLVQLLSNSVQVQDITVEKYGDVALIKNSTTNDVLGLNLFQASNYVDVSGRGHIECTEELVDHIQQALTTNGAVLTLNADLSPKFVVGYVETKEKHPNADKLSVCTVNVGDETLQIVCGAPNVEAGQKVVVAKVGAVMPSGTLIQEGNLRGIDSFGMICSARELDLPNAPVEKGILVLSEDVEVGIGFQK